MKLGKFLNWGLTELNVFVSHPVILGFYVFLKVESNRACNSNFSMYRFAEYGNKSIEEHFHCSGD